MGIELLSATTDEGSRGARLLGTVQAIFGVVFSLFRTLWTCVIRPCTSQHVELSSKVPLLLDQEKGYTDVYQSRAQLIAALQRRDAADAAFEAQVNALLAPIKQRLAEINRDSDLAGARWSPRAHRSDTPGPTDDRGTAPDLPPTPQIFCGREHELTTLVNTITPPRQARTALVGVEGSGTSTLALAFLHHAEAVRAFGARRFFVQCADSAPGNVAALAYALGLPHTLTADPIPVLAMLAACPLQTLVVLDGVQDATADLLAALARMPRVSLLLTKHTPLESTPLPRCLHNFTQLPVGPLPLPAARTLFRAIADLPADSERIDGDNALPVPPAEISVYPQPTHATPNIHSMVDESDGALIDALLHRAECLPSVVVELGRRAQYEPLPFLLACCLEEGSIDSEGVVL
ncbi:hypothetical protein C8F04DRAFT_1256486 [Mycena alexandri]|uniref:Uncharacterized protein n=1 Tax=Mycena alexandri TaxID=1745969 RepID=A0AAD6XAC2_9AGAR|nr:hypothetical protein C8F04DRAFT_1256486 [Mycena alexandri]